MTNQIQSECRCKELGCGCEMRTAHRCSCAERCDCKSACGCGEGCTCKAVLSDNRREHTMHGRPPTGLVMHEPSPDALAAYREAYEAAQPDPGRTVISVDLEARETDWEFSPGRSARAWGYNGQSLSPRRRERPCSCGTRARAR